MQLAKFWEFYGKELVIPEIEEKSLDFYKLHQVVSKLGGVDNSNPRKFWENVVLEYGCSNKSTSLLRKNFERFLEPFLVFVNSAAGVNFHLID